MHLLSLGDPVQAPFLTQMMLVFYDEKPPLLQNNSIGKLYFKSFIFI